MGPPLPQLGLGQAAAAHPRPLRVSCRACAAHARASPPPCRRQARGPRAGAGRPCPALQPRGRGAASRSSRGSRRPTPPSTTLEAPRTRLLSRATALLGASRGLCPARPGVAGRLPGGSASGSGLVCLVLFCVFILWSLMDTDPSIISPWKIKNSLGSCSPFILQVTLQLHDTRGVPQRGGGHRGLWTGRRAPLCPSLVPSLEHVAQPARVRSLCVCLGELSGQAGSSRPHRGRRPAASGLLRAGRSEAAVWVAFTRTGSSAICCRQLVPPPGRGHSVVNSI